jgi:hypothetical protein
VILTIFSWASECKKEFEEVIDDHEKPSRFIVHSGPQISFIVFYSAKVADKSIVEWMARSNQLWTSYISNFFMCTAANHQNWDLLSQKDDIGCFESTECSKRIDMYTQDIWPLNVLYLILIASKNRPVRIVQPRIHHEDRKHQLEEPRSINHVWRVTIQKGES